MTYILYILYIKTFQSKDWDQESDFWCLILQLVAPSGLGLTIDNTLVFVRIDYILMYGLFQCVYINTKYSNIKIIGI